MFTILDEIFGLPRFIIREDVMDVEYEDLTPPKEHEETYEDLTGENPSNP